MKAECGEAGGRGDGGAGKPRLEVEGMQCREQGETTEEKRPLREKKKMTQEIYLSQAMLIN